MEQTGWEQVDDATLAALEGHLAQQATARFGGSAFDRAARGEWNRDTRIAKDALARLRTEMERRGGAR